MKYFIYLTCLLVSLGLVFAEEKEKASVETKEVLLLPPALEKASKENKSVLLLFTGKDDCGACQVLEKTILATEKFSAYSKKNIIMVTLEYTESEAPTLEKRKLYEEFGVEGFPTLLLLDEKGVPYQRVSNEVETPEAFIEGLDLALKRKGLKAKFLAAKKDDEKKKLADEFLASRTEGENFIFYAELIAFGVLQNKELKAEDKIKQLSDLYLFSNDTSFVEKTGAEIKKLDPEKKLGSARLFTIKEFSDLILAHKEDKAYDYYLANKTKFVGNDLQYLYEFSMHLKEQGQAEKTIEILTYILSDEEIKKMPEAVKNLSDQIKDIKDELSKSKAGKSVEDNSVKKIDEPAKKTDEVKPAEKVEDKPMIKVEVEKVKKD